MTCLHESLHLLHICHPVQLCICRAQSGFEAGNCRIWSRELPDHAGKSHKQPQSCSLCIEGARTLLNLHGILAMMSGQIPASNTRMAMATNVAACTSFGSCSLLRRDRKPCRLLFFVFVCSDIAVLCLILPDSDRVHQRLTSIQQDVIMLQDDWSSWAGLLPAGRLQVS